MTDRRSHWDIDLVEGVGRRLIPLYRSIGYCTDAERHRMGRVIGCKALMQIAVNTEQETL